MTLYPIANESCFIIHHFIINHETLPTIWASLSRHVGPMRHSDHTVTKVSATVRLPPRSHDPERHVTLPLHHPERAACVTRSTLLAPGLTQLHNLVGGRGVVGGAFLSQKHTPVPTIVQETVNASRIRPAVAHSSLLLLAVLHPH